MVDIRTHLIFVSKENVTSTTFLNFSLLRSYPVAHKHGVGNAHSGVPASVELSPILVDLNQQLYHADNPQATSQWSAKHFSCMFIK